jgi:four helix bundle protein
MRDHHKLRAFQLADDLTLAVYKATITFPKHELFGLTQQLRRGVVSCASNIVEGCARHTEKDYLHFLDIAYGSVCEVQYQLTIAQRLGYFTPEQAQFLCASSRETSKVLNGLITSIRQHRSG